MVDGLGRQHADEISVGGCVTVGNFMEPCCKAMKGILRNAKKHKYIFIFLQNLSHCCQQNKSTETADPHKGLKLTQIF